MRRTVAAALVAVATALPLLPDGPAAGAGTARSDHSRAAAVHLALGETGSGQASAPSARAALQQAQQVVGSAVAPSDSPATTPAAGTLAMRDLFSALPRLSTSDRRQARAVLARPTDGSRDPDGYTTKAKRRCQGHFCLHWVSRTSDKASSAWVDKTMRTMAAVWRLEVGKLGYRRPVRDGHHGGNRLFDVYLKDLGSQGLYGYCTPEYLKPGRKREASGYCVLDNDFARSQFGTRPVNALKVTAAHEFFHAIQFGYDYKEDAWLMEATATWMEERYADGVNDNRQYLPYGQVGRPNVPLDTFSLSGFSQYGNWPFFEFLSSRYGVDTIRQIWNQAGQFPAGGHQYSAQALATVLQAHGGLSDIFTRYAAGNFMPGRTYAEGDQWPSSARPAPADTRTLGAGATAPETITVRHLASQDVVLRPASDLTGQGWHADISIDGPDSLSAPTAYVVVWTRDGRIRRVPVALDGSGSGTATVDFGHDDVKRVVLTLANTSIRFTCNQGTNYSCRGKPVDAKDTFGYTVAASQTP